MLTVLFFNGLCTSDMFMVLQVVVLWLYMSYKFCIIYLITKIYFSTKIYLILIEGWGGYIKRKIKWQLLVFYQNICKTTSKITKQANFFI